MTPLFKKLNFKDQKSILCLSAPESFLTELEAMGKHAEIIVDIEKANHIEFVIIFVTTKKEIEEAISVLAPKLEGDAVLWFCYPKGSSKKYKSDFNRDTGWESLGKYDLEGVRMVAIDSDWSAFRFRKVGYIKKMTRNKDFALSEKGKKRAE